MSDIRLVGLRKAFGKQEVLRGLDLVVPFGKITVIIGRSGTGKSVLLKQLMGLLRPDSGSIFIGDTDITRLPEGEFRKVRNRFGMVFQNAALFDSMTVYENVAFPLREHTRLREREIRERVVASLASVGLADAIDKDPHQISGGMKKRVAVARALIRKPEFLLFDEPTTGLDPIMTAHVDELIRHTQDTSPGLTSLVISHDMEATLRIADKIAMLFEGRVIFEGTADDVRSTDHPVVRQFVEGRLEGPIKV
ncbi:MAG: ATP-binding cassette domain-containing protein [Deltaproteobacteria bacterium]|nr:ATP-binding cassette domain-containing protein [Deltaproteobacteria bacterium]